MDYVVNVIGAGLAGCEATYQLIKRGIKVRLYEMRPGKSSPAHKTDGFAELVCSNSLRARSIENAVGLLKEEMNRLDSLIMKCALNNEVEAGGALAVDRTNFSNEVTYNIRKSDLVEVIEGEVTDLPAGPTIIATGPLTSDALSAKIKEFFDSGDLYFYDAVAPIVAEASINKNVAYLKSRYDKGEASYYNCPMTEEEFNHFYEELVNAKVADIKDFELKVFEGCMAIEEMARRGKQTLLFGPMKPVGLRNPKTGEMPYAVVQLRQDDAAKTMYNIVGFQTHLLWPEQKRVFRLIPGLENAEIVRYGVMHRNTYIQGPKVLNKYYQTLKRSDLFFAGQITGVEGYLESAASGMVAAINMAKFLKGEEMLDFTRSTALGALQNYVATPNSNYVPMNVNFGIFDEITGKMKKQERKLAYANRSLAIIEEMKVKL
ncbi:MAG: methylenetetrahydrofolate--tRNA-(uracil(54)-C(5))-methyltransferase (FADH(2)-oxidizing) TrmFO [Bacilli bacterium]|nr:methylenetetrahydrofolate--tRNA-(uracil(54)-C(5))-methyltransferase (FADH(2)-oxidizing) TrmFO [Bacilli bacterium]